MWLLPSLLPWSNVPRDIPVSTQGTSLWNVRKVKYDWAGEMAQRLRALTALPEVLSSIPSNPMVAHNHGILMPSSDVSEDSYTVVI